MMSAPKGKYDFYNIGMKVMRFVRDNAELVNGGQGNITISCPALWEMKDDEFIETFLKGLTIREVDS